MNIRNKFSEYAPAYYTISIHSPNIITRSNFLGPFSLNERYDVEYSQINTQLVAGSFETDCVDYDIRNKHGLMGNENDCHINCIAQFKKGKS